MADIKVELKNSLNSKIYPKTTLDNIVKSVASSTTLITSGGVIKKDFLDLTGLISANYVSSANVIPTSAINGLSTAIKNGASSYVNSSGVVPVSAIINFNSAVSSAIGSSLQPEISAGFGINITGGSTISLARTRPITTIPSTSTSVTLQPGEAYIIDATTTSKTLNVGSVPSGHFGLESHMEIFVANTGYIVTGTNVVLTQPLEPDSVNNCTIRFHDGFAIISVEDYVAGYIVVSSGSASNTSGTLAYGLTSASSNYIAFDGRLNGSVIPFGGVTANGKKHVVGNGYDNTILTGSVNCGASKFTVANLSLQDIIVNGGTMTLGDVCIPSGGTVSMAGGSLAVEKVSGSGGVIDLGQTSVRITQNQTAMLSGVMITGRTRGIGVGTMASGVSPATLSMYGCTMYGLTATGAGAAANGGAISMDNITGGQYNPSEATLVGCTISGNKAPGGGGIFAYRFSQLTLSGCSVTGNVTTGKLGAGILLNSSSFATIDNCVISGNSYSTSTKGHDITLNEVASALITGGKIGEVVLGSGGTATFGGTVVLDNVIPTSNTVSGNVVISSGASINLTSSIAPGGSVMIPAGAVVTILGSGGTTSAYLSELALTGTTITNAPAVLGATVTVPATGGPWEVYFADHTTSTYSATGTQRQVVLTGAVTYVGGL